MGDTWRPWIGPRVSLLFATNRTRVNFLFAIHQPTTTCHVTIVRSYDPGTSPYRLYGQVKSTSKNFACLAWWTDRDIFSIRTPFEKVNIPPELGRRDKRNGTIFVAFWALWKLSKIWSLDHRGGWRMKDFGRGLAWVDDRLRHSTEWGPGVEDVTLGSIS